MFVGSKKSVLAVIAVLVFSFIFFGCVQQNGKSSEDAKNLSVNVIINFGERNVSKTVSIAKGQTALAAFDEAAVLNKTSSKWGIFVSGIDGIDGNMNGNGKYWQYYVDGILAPVGADAYVLENDVALEFRYELPPESLG